MHARDSEAELRQHVYTGAASGITINIEIVNWIKRGPLDSATLTAQPQMFALIRKFMALDDDDSSSSPTYFDMMTLIAQDGVPFQNPGNCIGSVNCIAASGGRAETG